MKRASVIIAAFSTVALIVSVVLLIPQIKTWPSTMDEASIGAIKTSGSDKTSTLSLYSSSLKQVSEIQLNEASLNSPFYDPVVNNGILYAIPQGMADKKDARLLVSMNLSNSKITEYAIDQLAMNSVAVNERYAFTCNTINRSSFINRCNLSSKETDSIEIKDAYISLLVCEGSYLYSFASSIDDERSWIDVLDQDLNHFYSIDTSDYGSGVYRACRNGNKIYFTVLTLRDQGNRGRLVSLNTETRELKEIDTPDYPLSVEFHNDKLYVACSQLIENRGTSSLVVLDSSGNMLEQIPLQHATEQLIVNDEGIYALSNGGLSRYDINDFSLLSEVTLLPRGDEYRYVSGIFDVAS